MTVLFVLCSSRDLSVVMFGFENQGYPIYQLIGFWVLLPF